MTRYEAFLNGSGAGLISIAATRLGADYFTAFLILIGLVLYSVRDGER